MTLAGEIVCDKSQLILAADSGPFLAGVSFSSPAPSGQRDNTPASSVPERENQYIVTEEMQILARGTEADRFMPSGPPQWEGAGRGPYL